MDKEERKKINDSINILYNIFKINSERMLRENLFKMDMDKETFIKTYMLAVRKYSSAVWITTMENSPDIEYRKFLFDTLNEHDEYYKQTMKELVSGK